ncbi:hypothetical protein PCASD_11584 [Puccinia coronata f. sp. avenae]|uniref:Uncharacterized protein n=1 Tax=Puccinia coronata f. sp. avenae TaxID=200324 RepID=A0A2N5TG61_9BASI|nr:hypothetical protein PCASD_11584 [Puccinia coronata f. sp. avenae]
MQSCELASPTELPLRDLEQTLAAHKVYLSSSGAATEAANNGGGGPIPPLAATFGSFACQRSTPAINRHSINWTNVTHW